MEAIPQTPGRSRSRIQVKSCWKARLRPRTPNRVREELDFAPVRITIDYRMRRDSDSAPSGEACRCGEDRRYPRRPWAYGRRSTIAWRSGRKKRHAARQTRDPLRYECARVVPLPAGDARFGRSSAAGFHAAVPPADRNKTSILRKKFFQAGCSSPTACTLPLPEDRKSTRLNSSHSQISYAVFCLKKKKKI